MAFAAAAMGQPQGVEQAALHRDESQQAARGEGEEMSIQAEVADVIESVLEEHEIRRVVWVGAGGSFAGHWAANYFLQRESSTIVTEMHTSGEFVLAPPPYVNEGCLCVVTSMRGTPETCEAARVARERGAATIALYVEESQLTAVCDHKIRYESIALDESRTERVNSSVALQIAMTLLARTEGYADFEKAMAAFDAADAIYRRAVERTRPLAEAWARRVAGERIIYVLGSGPAYGSAYIFSICNIEEMLQIDSPTVNCCEFFHGPFEVVDEAKPVFLLLSVGRCRAADERALTFLRRYAGESLHVLDGMSIGLGDLPEEVSEYFNHVLFSPILNNVYMRALSAATHKDYMTRRYMWRVEY